MNNLERHSLFSPVLLLQVMLALGVYSAPATALCAESPDSFLPTWKLLNRQQKQHFISGYLQGWRDARKVTDIATKYVKNNPQSAVESLESISSIYNLSDLRPPALVESIDRFYSEPENKTASLSAAISASRGMGTPQPQ